MSEIVVNLKDGTRWESNKVYGVIYAAGELIILREGIFAEHDSKIFDDTLVRDYTVKIGEWK